ncbi:hypothetical protein BDV33DRAFT_208524 [Aspergillus novoparasiticus]|uniref:GPI ethanolamine phosphate transferase 1 C-terminal domain-containing protein n=1 Tax=Aspergillus novoparasiticus TaxID=986946 RepID=A0A5N6ECB3_9EURO|nr:hypothetical protein BDV33DRAFT_208524 [Aspergillus novoparasiticus]
MKILSQDSERKTAAIDRISKGLLTLQVGLVPLTLLVTLPAASLQSKEGRGYWVGQPLVMTSFTPLIIYPRTGIHRVVIFFIFAPLFILLTISSGGLFYCSIGGALFTWVQLESRIVQFQQLPPSSSSSKESDSISQVRPSTSPTPASLSSSFTAPIVAFNNMVSHCNVMYAEHP